MIINEEGTYNLIYTATDECGNETVVNRELVVEMPIYSWADGTDEQIVAMVQAADEGKINLADYWHVGDERVVHLDAMEATGVGESHAEQDVTFVLMNVGGKTLNTPTESGRTECSFIVGQKDCLNEKGYMNPTMTCAGGWDASARRTWCNDVYYNAIPSTLRPIFKQIKNNTANNGGSDATATTESTDFFALAAEREVLGEHVHSNATYEANLTQFEYYVQQANRVKKVGVNASLYFDRSPFSNRYYFCSTTSSGSGSGWEADGNVGIAPFGAI